MNYYYAVLKDGNVFMEKKVEDLPVLDSVLCYLRSVSSEEYVTQYGNIYHWYRYEFIDREMNPVPFKVGTCEVVFIEKDDGSYYLKSRNFLIRDQYGREGKFSISGNKFDGGSSNIEKIATKLVPFMRELSSEGGWDAYWNKKYPDFPDNIRIVYE